MNKLSLPCERILVTGGAGYIASHVIATLVEHFFPEVSNLRIISVDNFHNSTPDHIRRIYETIEYILQKKGIPVRSDTLKSLFVNYEVDIRDFARVSQIFEKEKPHAVIHFAALKYVGEALQKPAEYYTVNIGGTAVLLEASIRNVVPVFIFSSSCAVYGDIPLDLLPVKEDTPFSPPPTPYHHSKRVCEEIIEMFASKGKIKAVSLRYFNPAGAHDSHFIGDLPLTKAQNIFPALMRVILKRETHFVVNGTDYPTPDGTCIRDYIHVIDLAMAHIMAIEYAWSARENYSVFNLGSGRGYSVREIINQTERTLNIKIPVVEGPRREGDATALYADYSKAQKLLGWVPGKDLSDMIKSSFNFYKKMLERNPSVMF